MEKKIVLIAAVLIVLVGGFYLFAKPQKKQLPVEPKGGDLTNMKILSPAFLNNQSVPQKYTCYGEDINPPLTIEQVPQGTKSLILIVDDPDAPAGTWLHWLVFNLDPETAEIEENSVPSGGVLGKNDFGKIEYGGPCPPSGTHRYFFKLYALDSRLEVSQGASKAKVEEAMKNHILASAELVGVYRRD